MKQIVAFSFFISTVATAQVADSLKQNEIFSELGGTSLLIGINYQRRFKNNKGLGLRIGVGIYGGEPQLIVPFGILYRHAFKKRGSYLDAGMAGVIASNAERIWLYASAKLNGPLPKRNVVPLASLTLVEGFARKWNFRFGLAAVFTSIGTLPHISLGLGRTF